MIALLRRVGLAGLLAAPLVSACAASRATAEPPAAPAVPAPDPEAWRATAPTAGPEPTWKAPAVQTFTLANGIPVYLVQNDGLPLVSVRLVLQVGREANPAGKAGLGALTAQLLPEGTTHKSGADLAAATAMLGATLNVAPGTESVVVALDALTGDTLGPSLDLFADLVRNPRFDKADFARVQSNVLATIDAAGSDPRELGGRAAARALYGADHPYGQALAGSRGSVKAISLKDVQAYYKSWWIPQNVALVVSGAIDTATAKPLLDARFGDWKVAKGAKPRPTVTPAAVPLKPRVVFVEVPGAVQSVLRVITPAMPRTSSDFPAAFVEGTLVGGMFSSRINMNLREEHGWSYGAYGGFVESRDNGLFGVRTQVQADKTAPAITEVLKELTNAAAKAPSADDLKLAKDSVLKALPGDFETNAGISGSVANIPTYGLPADFLATWPGQVAGVESDAAWNMAKKYFDANRYLLVVAGPRTVKVGDTTTDVVAELKALGFEFTEYTADELR